MGETNVDYDLGADFKSSFEFVDGDLSLVEHDKNLGQAVINRLNTILDELDLFYDDYGSVLNHFFGWKRGETTLSYVEMEVEKVLSEEPRLYNFDVSANYNVKGDLEIHLSLKTVIETEIEMNLVLSPENEIVELEELED